MTDRIQPLTLLDLTAVVAGLVQALECQAASIDDLQGRTADLTVRADHPQLVRIGVPTLRAQIEALYYQATDVLSALETCTLR